MHHMQQSEHVLSKAEEASFVLDAEDKDTVPALKSW